MISYKGVHGVLKGACLGQLYMNSGCGFLLSVTRACSLSAVGNQEESNRGRLLIH